LCTAVPFLVGATWRLPDTYHPAGFRRGTATLKFYEDRDILMASSRTEKQGRPVAIACAYRQLRSR